MKLGELLKIPLPSKTHTHRHRHTRYLLPLQFKKLNFENSPDNQQTLLQADMAALIKGRNSAGIFCLFQILFQKAPEKQYLMSSYRWPITEE